MAAAPTLTGQAGSIIGILDACLQDGFGSKSASSLVVAGGIATLTFSGGASSAQVGSVILVAGATPSGLNGEQKVLSANSTTVTFATGLSNQTATGTITFKMAPAGFTKAFTGTNLAAYRSDDVTGNRMYLRVDDTGTTNARVVGYETMSDVNTGTGPFPTASQQSGGDYWTKSSTANSTTNIWYLFTNGKIFYFARAFRSGNNGLNLDFEIHGFGDISSVKSGDAFNVILSGNGSDQSASNVTATSNLWYGASNWSTGFALARSYSGLGSAVQAGKYYPSMNGSAGGCSGANSAGSLFPNPADGGLYVVPLFVFETTGSTANNVYRGVVPGFYCTPQLIPNGTYTPGDLITGVTGLAGKVLKVMTCQFSSSVSGLVAFDITGPW